METKQILHLQRNNYKKKGILMKKYLVLPLALLLGILVASCSDTTTNPPAITQQGSIFINSDPNGAEIWLNGQNTGKVTPDSITALDPDNYQVTLKLGSFSDTSFTVSVVADLQTTKFISFPLDISSFGPKIIYETAGTTTSQPSGLDLSSGMAYGVSGLNNDLVDIYYSTSGTGGTPYLVQSANLYPLLTRETSFLVGSGTVLGDGADSPTYPLDGTWTDHMGDHEANYVFLYDEDGHYSKIIVSDYHIGSGQNDPSWVEITWLYNNTGADSRF
jgi:hypothetical protein